MAQAGEPPMEVRRDARVGFVLAGMEVLLLVMVALSPWAYGAVHPGFSFLLDAGVGLLLALWGVRMMLEGRLAWQKCPVALCLAGLFLLGIWQAQPWPRPLLAWLSPGTARMVEPLLPSTPEELPAGEEPLAAATPAGSTISVNPAATRQLALRLLAVFLVFVVVRNNLVSTSRLRRLCVVCAVNGAALALFAIVQLFTSSRSTVYWTYPTLGNVYGPFICRNHFPFYVNACIGLGVGLLLAGRTSPRRRGLDARERGQFESASSILHDPRALWIGLALALMIASVALSLSRGGLLALLGGLGIWLLPRLFSSRDSLRLGIGVLIAVAAFGFAGWLGFNSIKARLGTLWQPEAFEEGRIPMWLRMLPGTAEFPIWGTGLATFRYVEPLRRTSAANADMSWDHAHNEYLEMLVEGGAVGLVLSLLIIGWVYALGMRGLRRHAGHSAAGLVLGALIAFTTLVFHSFADFGMHIPAITLLATVLCAYLSGLGQATTSGGRKPPDSSTADSSTSPTPSVNQGANAPRSPAIAPVVGAGVCVGLGVILAASSWKAHFVDRFQRAAQLQVGADGMSAQRRVALLSKAVSLEPENAELLFEWGQAQDQPDQNIGAALRGYLAARDACPLLPRPQMALAAYRDQLAKADPRSVYLERAQRVAPCNPEVWYLSGLQELAANEPARAWACWRRCLELSDVYLNEILQRAGAHLQPETLAELVLPARPEMVLTAALRFDPDGESIEKRRPILEHALKLLESLPQPLDADNLHTKALVLKALGQAPQAVQTYQTLLMLAPEQIGWRFEFAQFLFGQRRLDEARRQLLIVIAQEPEHGAARELYAVVIREIARQE